MDSKIGFEMSLIVVESIRGRCASFMILTARVSEIFGEQTNSSILVANKVYIYLYIYFICNKKLNDIQFKVSKNKYSVKYIIIKI